MDSPDQEEVAQEALWKILEQEHVENPGELEEPGDAGRSSPPARFPDLDPEVCKELEDMVEPKVSNSKVLCFPILLLLFQLDFPSWDACWFVAIVSKLNFRTHMLIKHLLKDFPDSKVGKLVADSHRAPISIIFPTRAIATSCSQAKWN